MSKPIDHILVIRLSAMGDVAMTVPVIRTFTEQHPDVKITVLTRQLFVPFFDDLKNVSTYVADVKGKHRGISGLFQLSRELRRLKIDAVADLHNVLRSKILKVFLFGIPVVQINKGRAEKKALIQGDLFKNLKSTHQRYADVFAALGFTLKLSSPSIPSSRPLTKATQQIVAKNKTQIGIAPFAAFEGKAYPLELIEEVIALLPQDYGILLFGGGKSEIKQLDDVASKFDNVTNLAGKFQMADELKIMSHLDLMVSMDSGNGHMAAMLGVSVITIWGVTHPYAGFAPFDQPDGNSLLSDRSKFPEIPTSIYGNRFPEGYENAIRTVTPETIAAKVVAVITNKTN